ncbi:MAG: AraC family transcriptional regulator [Gammaproteobacteria bacterium]|nr:AraC family transcriptional regulator [Gammaproteobacteria bacterium]
MTEIPIVKARYAHAFAATLETLGIPAHKMLRAHRLSPELISNQEAFITAHQLWSFAGKAALAEAVPELGLLAGRVPVVEHGDFGKMVYQAINLNDAIQTFCNNAQKEYSRADFYLTRDEHQAWFCRGPIDGDDAMQIQQVELYLLSLMVDTIRLGAGSQWQPDIIYLQNRDSRGLADIPLFRNANTRFGFRATAIGFPLSLLNTPLQIDIAACPKPEKDLDDIAQSSDFGNSLRRVLKNYLPHHDLSLEVAAEITGLTRRTLQRRLSGSDLTYQNIIDQLRYDSALPLLRDRQQNLLEIALELGYSDAAHFTRAFRRWAGMTPSCYRKQHAA